MVNESEKEKFIKVNDSLLEIKECKSGYFTIFRKMVLSKLMYLYQYYKKTDESGNVIISKYKDGRTYHFYWQQSNIANEMGADKSNIGKAMKWLQKEGYITYFCKSKPGDIWRTTYITMNEKFINSKIGNEKPTPSPPPDNAEEIDNNSIPTDPEISREEQLSNIENTAQLPIENIPTVTTEKVNQEKIFGKEQLEIYLSNNKMVHFDSIREKGYEPESPEYEDLVNLIWSLHSLREKDKLYFNPDSAVSKDYANSIFYALVEIYENQNELDEYLHKALTKTEPRIV